MLEGLVRVPGDVLVSVGGLPVDVELKGAAGLTQDGEVQHVDPVVFLTFGSPLDVWVDGVDVGKERGNMIAMYGRHRVVCLTIPKEDDAWDGGGQGVGGGVMEVAVCGEGAYLKLRHVCVGEGGRCGASHSAALRDGIKHFSPSEVGETQDCFEEGDDDGYGYVGAT